MPAMMTAREFVDTIAVPTVRDFMAEPTQRRGYLACLAAYHVGDYLKPPGDYMPTDLHGDMEKRFGARTPRPSPKPAKPTCRSVSAWSVCSAFRSPCPLAG